MPFAAEFNTVASIHQAGAAGESRWPGREAGTQHIKENSPPTAATRGRALPWLLAALATLTVAAPAQAGPFTYVTNSGGNNVSQYDVDAFGALTPKSPATAGAGSGPLGVAVSPNGASVYVANSNSNNVSQYDVGASGALTPKSTATVAAGANPRAVVVSPNGASVYVTNFGGGNVSQYDVGAGGALTPKSPATVAAGTNPYGVAISPNGAYVYVSNFGSGTVSMYDVGAGGVLTPKSPATIAAGTFPAGVAVNPNGASVYVANNGGNNISQYDVGGGVLSPKVPATVAAGVSPTGVAVSPSGANVYVANNGGGGSVSLYDVGGGGALTPKSPATVTAGSGPQAVVVSLNGASVYVANNASGDVSQFNVGAGGALAPKSPATVGAGSGPAGVAVTLGPAPPYPIPGTAPEVKGSLVQVFRQCGTGGNPVNATHAPSLGLGSCNPPVPVSPNARVGSGGFGSVTMTVVPGDYQIAVLDSDIRTPSGADYDPNGAAGNDIRATAKLRITDTGNCTPSGCGGPYTQSATTTDFDFGPVPVNCVPNGSPTAPPGSDCNLTTSVNAVSSGTLVAGRLTSITVFRLRVNDHANTLFQQQGDLVF